MRPVQGIEQSLVAGIEIEHKWNSFQRTSQEAGFSECTELWTLMILILLLDFTRVRLVVEGIHLLNLPSECSIL